MNVAAVPTTMRIQNDLNSGFDKVSVPLDLGGSAHVHVFVSNGYDHSSDDGRIHLASDLDGLTGFNESLKSGV